MKVTILGANGPIGKALALELKNDKSVQMLQLAARSYQSKRENNIVYEKADLLHEKETENVVKGMDVAYLTVGLPYKFSLWKKEWPIIIQNVITACEKYNVKLIFFDNVYAYGLVNGPMTEETPLHPNSKKGQIRKQIDEMIMSEVSKKKLTAVIAKAADYYGSYAKASILYVQNIENLVEGKKPFWLGNAKKLHAFTYIPDAAKALVILGKSNKADNQVWHIPTAKALPGDTFMRLIAQTMNKSFQYATITKIMARLFGIINSDVAEIVEMFYQYDHDYIFDSSKFEKTFNMIPTSYDKCLQQTVKSFL